jgi:hypothetical protein
MKEIEGAYQECFTLGYSLGATDMQNKLAVCLKEYSDELGLYSTITIENFKQSSRLSGFV